jgi:hypothetical protein
MSAVGHAFNGPLGHKKMGRMDWLMGEDKNQYAVLLLHA